MFYQLHFPRGGRISYIASYNVETGERIWLQYDPDQSSIHDNSSPDGKLFCGDGDNRSPWIFLFHPVRIRDQRHPGRESDQGRLSGIGKTGQHVQAQLPAGAEPQLHARQKYIVFRSNMFGPDYAFAVEVAKAKSSP